MGQAAPARGSAITSEAMAACLQPPQPLHRGRTERGRCRSAPAGSVGRSIAAATWAPPWTTGRRAPSTAAHCDQGKYPFLQACRNGGSRQRSGQRETGTLCAPPACLAASFTHLLIYRCPVPGSTCIRIVNKIRRRMAVFSAWRRLTEVIALCATVSEGARQAGGRQDPYINGQRRVGSALARQIRRAPALGAPAKPPRTVTVAPGDKLVLARGPLLVGVACLS